MLALVAVGVPVPADTASLSIAKIVNVRRRYGPELLPFQTVATTLVRDHLLNLNPAQADPGAVRAHVEIAHEHVAVVLYTEHSDPGLQCSCSQHILCSCVSNKPYSYLSTPRAQLSASNSCLLTRGTVTHGCKARSENVCLFL